VGILSFTKAFDWTKIKYVLRGILVGIAVSIIVSLFRFSISAAVDFTVNMYDFLREEPVWILGWGLVSILAAFILALFLRDEPNVRGSGIQDLEGQLQGAIDINWFSVLWRKFIGSVLSIGSGLALGREGPSIQIGGVVGQGVNRFLKGDRAQENILVSSGAAAGLAAAFNTPVSGVLFAVDEIHKKLSNGLILSTFTASVTANFITYQLLNIDPSIDIDPLAIFPLDFYYQLIVLGIFVGVAGWFYQEVTLWVQDLYRKIPLPNYLIPLIPFLLVIPVGLFFPEMLGGGDALINVVTQTPFSIRTLVMIIAFRFIFMNASYGSGLPGGIFLPLLSLGALLGALFSNGAINLTSISDIYLSNFVIFAMGGLLTAVTKAPLMAVMLIVEMSGRVTHVMPLAVVCLMSYVTADFLRSGPIYEVLLDKKLGAEAVRFKGEISEFELIVEPSSQLDDMLVKDLNMPAGSVIIRVHRGHREFIPDSQTVITANDTLVIETDSGTLHRTQEYLEPLNELQ